MKYLSFSAVAVLLIVASSLHCSAQEDLGGERIYQAVSGAVVQVQAFDNRNLLLGSASAVVLKSRGWLVTNFHVFSRGGLLVANKNGDYLLLGNIVRADRERDILIISVYPDFDVPLWTSIPDLLIVPRDSLRTGQRIYALGNPLGLENTITDGLISGLRTSSKNDIRLIQVSAPISAGSSGGAIVDGAGRLIGMSTFIMGDAYAQNLNFAIPISQVVEWDPDSLHIDIKQITQDAHYARGLNLWHAGEIRAAQREFSIVPDSAKEQRAMSMYYSGRCLELMKEKQEAEYWYELAVMRDPLLARAILGLGRLQVERGEMDKGFSNQLKAYKLDPKLRDVDYALGD